MGLIEVLATIFHYAILAFGGFIVLIIGMVVFAIIFGKKIETEYDLEAEFYEGNKEIAEFDIKSWRYQKEGGDYQLKIKFEWQDQRLSFGDQVEVLLENQTMLSGKVTQAGKVHLNIEHLINTPRKPATGQLCQVKLNGVVVLEQALKND